MIQKRSYSLSTKVNLNFYGIVKILPIMKIIRVFFFFILKRHETFSDNSPKEN